MLSSSSSLVESLQMEILGLRKESIFLLLWCSRENTREHNSVRLKKTSGSFIGRLVFTNVTSELLHSKRYYHIKRLFALVVAQASLNSLEKSLFAQSSKHWVRNVAAVAKPLLLFRYFVWQFAHDCDPPFSGPMSSYGPMAHDRLTWPWPRGASFLVGSVRHPTMVLEPPE